MHQIHTMGINNIYNEGISQESGETAMPPSKKMIPSMILDILKRRTDENHTLDQKDILDELNQEFDPPVPSFTRKNRAATATISGQTFTSPEISLRQS